MTTSSRIGPPLALVGAGVEDRTPVRLVRLRGEIDAFSAPRLRDDLRREVGARPAFVALDLTGLQFLGVAGLNVLLEVRQLAEERGTTVLLVGSPAPHVERMLGLVGWPVVTDPTTSRDQRRQPPPPE